jgi:hypothetical protein
MNALQWLAAGDPAGKMALLQSVWEIRSNPLVQNNLVEGYLKDLNQPELAAQLAGLETVRL